MTYTHDRPNWKAFLTFKFVDRKLSSVKIENDGNNLTKKKTGWCVIQIGEFLDVKDKLIHTITLKFDGGENIVGRSCIGFIANDFDSFYGGSWSILSGKRCSFIANNGYYITNGLFGSIDGNLSSSHSVRTHSDGWYRSGDIMKVKIDTDKMKAIIWNTTPKKKDKDIKPMDDLNVDEEYKDYVGFYFKINLPKHVDCAMAIVAGLANHTVEIVDHNIEYLK